MAAVLPAQPEPMMTTLRMEKIRVPRGGNQGISEEEISQSAQRRAGPGGRRRLCGGERAAGCLGQQDEGFESLGAFGAGDGGAVAILRSGLAQGGADQAGPGIANAVFE